jgi:ADP-ribose pyrophosphatase YjhB (NUDIX family)
MYKVFIKEHVLTVADSKEFSTEIEDGLRVYDPDCEELNLLISHLLKDDQAKAFRISYREANPMNEFTRCFRYLEAAGGLVHNSEGDILMIYRFQKWDLPKGKLEVDESPSEGALREVQEECGLKSLTIDAELPATFHIYEQKGQIHLKKTHWFNMKAAKVEQLTPQMEEGIEKVKWMNPMELQKARENTYSSLKDLLS